MASSSSLWIGSGGRALFLLAALVFSFISLLVILVLFFFFLFFVLIFFFFLAGLPPRDGAEKRVFLQDRHPHPRAELLLVVLEERGADLFVYLLIFFVFYFTLQSFEREREST